MDQALKITTQRRNRCPEKSNDVKRLFGIQAGLSKKQQPCLFENLWK
jgi:hypothetical protein